MKHRPRRPFSRAVVTAAVALACASAPGLASAIPAIGAECPEATLRDGWDRTTTLSRFRSKPILVIYEDQASTSQNQAFKSELSRLARDDRYRRKVALVAVADVSGYDYWPARGFVKDAIQSESNKQGLVIYCDWSGGLRRTFGFEQGASNVVLFGRNGKAVFAERGALSAQQQAQVIALLRKEVDG